MKTVPENPETILNIPIFTFYGSHKEKGNRKCLRKYLKILYMKTSLTWERKHSLKYRKCRDSHIGKKKKTRKNMPKHILIKLKLKKKKNILKAAGKK